MIIKTILIFLLGLLGYSEWMLGTSYIQRPIVLGTLTGLIMGDLQAGIIMGATMELAMIGAVSVGAYVPPDMISGTIIGVSLAIASGTGAETMLTLGLPIATVIRALLNSICMPFCLIFVHRCDKCAENADTKGFFWNWLLTAYTQNILGIICIPLAFYFGADMVTSVLGHIPDFVQTGMTIATGLLPAMGFAMLARMMFSKKVAAFFFIGFLMVSCLGLTTIGVSLFSILLVIVMIMFGIIGNDQNNLALESERGGGNFDEF